MAKSPVINGKPAIGAGVAGASGGTGLLALVNSIPEGNSWKPVLIFAAPTVSIVISGLWVFAKKQIDTWVADRRLASEVRKAEIALQAIEADQHSSERVRKEARAKFETLRMLQLTLHSDRAHGIASP